MGRKKKLTLEEHYNEVVADGWLLDEFGLDILVNRYAEHGIVFENDYDAIMATMTYNEFTDPVKKTEARKDFINFLFRPKM